jgi:hypothetical protein
MTWVFQEGVERNKNFGPMSTSTKFAFTSVRTSYISFA